MPDKKEGVEQAPEGTPSNPETQTGTPSQEQPQGWSKEQEAVYTQKTQELSRLKKMAEDDGFGDDVDSYIAFLKENNAKLAQQIEESKPKPTGQPKPESKPKPYDFSTFEEQAKTSQATAFRAQIEANWATYRLDQSQLTEEKRWPYGRNDLNEYINKNSELMARLYLRAAQSNDDANYYAIAARCKALEDGGFKKPEAKPKVDTKAAEEAAKLATSTAPPAGEKPKTDQQKQADDIIPDDNYVMPT